MEACLSDAHWWTLAEWISLDNDFNGLSTINPDAVFCSLWPWYGLETQQHGLEQAAQQLAPRLEFVEDGTVEQWSKA
jgi:hypothetical protein